MNKKRLMLSIAVFWVAIVQAETVAWYHFNEGVDGTSPEGGNPAILNAVDGQTLPASAYQITSRTSPTISTTGNYLPRYESAFPAGLTWKDPLTGAVGVDGMSLYFGDSGTADGRGSSSLVVVDNDSALRCAMVTVECMLKADSGLAAGWRDIVLMRNEKGERVAWGFYGASNGGVNLVMYPLSGSASVNVKSTSTTLFDGKWHHVAFTYDGENVRLYFDYNLEQTVSLAGGIGYAEGDFGRLCLGSNDKVSYGRWNGWIDELRISDVALPPESFIRPTTIAASAAPVDSDVVFYQSFDTCFTSDSLMFGTVGAPFFPNEASPAVKPIATAYISSGGKAPVGSGTVSADQIHAGVLATTSKLNTGSWFVGPDAETAGKSFCVQFDDTSMNAGTHLITGGDFTFEMFFRCPSAPNRTSYLLSEGDTLAIRINDGGALCCDVVSTEGSSATISKSGCVDGAWHHLSLVSDRTAQTVTFYVDKEPVRQLNSFVLKSVAGVFQFGGGWGRNTQREFQNIYLDELRITRRALLVQEFLSSGAAFDASDLKTRAFISFENDFRIDPQYLDASDGVPSASGVSFSTSMPGFVYTFLNGGTNVIVSNACSVSFAENGKVVFPRNLMLEREMQEMTIEFFVKVPVGQVRTWSNVIGLFKNPGSDIPVWLVSFRTESGELLVQGRNSEDVSDQNLRFGSDSEVGDGHWHHVAFTFEKSGNGLDTIVTCYRDYRYASAQQFSGALDYSSANTMLSMGRMPGNWGQFTGRLDGVRISKGVLLVNQMLKALRKGTTIVFR